MEEREKNIGRYQKLQKNKSGFWYKLPSGDNVFAILELGPIEICGEKKMDKYKSLDARLTQIIQEHRGRDRAAIKRINAYTEVEISVNGIVFTVYHFFCAHRYPEN